jgi:carboxyl-terminal processing protease
MVFDYHRRVLILEPNSRFAEPYPYDASGIVLRLTKDLKHFRVHAVLPASPAAEAGLRPDDRITAINGHPAARLDLTEVQHVLLKRKGAQHRLDVQRGDKQWQVTIKLRELL